MSTIETLNYAECVTLLDTLQNDRGTYVQKCRGIRDYTMALLMLDAGLRVGEVVKLRVSDLWLQSEPVTSIIVRAEIAKRHHERKIPCSERLCNAIKLLHTYYWSHFILFNNSFAFAASKKSQPPTTRRVEQIIKAAGLKAFKRDIHPHILRHTFATRLMSKTSMPVVQELLGHKSIKTTQIYTHPNDQDLKSAIEGIAPGRDGE